MKKQEYVSPDMEIVKIAHQSILVISEGGVGQADPDEFPDFGGDFPFGD